MLLALPLGMALTARLSPPAAGTAYTFRNDLALRPRYAIQRLSGDHATPRSMRAQIAGRERPLVLRREVEHAQFLAVAHERERLPSGETRGARVAGRRRSSAASRCCVVKSYRNSVPTPSRSET